MPQPVSSNGTSLHTTMRAASTQQDASSSRFPLPDSFAPTPGEGFSVVGVPHALSAPHQRLATRVSSQPRVVLEDILFAQRAAYGVNKEIELTAPWLRHGPRLLVNRLLGRIWNRFEAPHVAAAVGVEGLAHLGECVSRDCPLNRLAYPHVRAKADAHIVDAIDALHRRDTVLKVTFVGAGGMFAELALLQRLRDRGFTRIDAAFIDYQVAPFIARTHGRSVEEEMKRGYDEAYHNAKVKAFEEVAGYLATTFGASSASFYANSRDYIQEHQRQNAPGCHAVIALDPGSDGLEIQAACDSVMAIQACTGAPRCLSTAFFSAGGVPMWLRDIVPLDQLPPELRAPPKGQLVLATRNNVSKPSWDEWTADVGDDEPRPTHIAKDWAVAIPLQDG